MANSEALDVLVSDLTQLSNEYIVAWDWFLDKIISVNESGDVKVYNIVGYGDSEDIYRDLVFDQIIASDQTMLPFQAKKLAQNYLDSIYDDMEIEIIN